MEPAAPSVRIDRSEPATVTRPPGWSLLTLVRAWLTEAAVTPKEARRSGSSSTAISRLTPPERLTSPTPWIDSSARLTSLSTNQLISSGDMVEDRTTQVIRASPVMSMRWTLGSCMSCGRLERRPLMALRTSLVARSVSVPSSNSITVEEEPSLIDELM